MKKVLKSLLIIFIVVTPAIIINSVMTEKIETSNYFKKIEKDVLTYLELRYGEGNFKIINTDYIGGCNLFGNCGTDGYEVSLSTEYFNKKFKVIILRGNGQIYSDSFIKVLAKEKWNIDANLHEYISELALEKVNKSIPLEFDSKISFDSIKTDENFNFIFYGKLPNIDDLIKSTTFYNPKIEIDIDLNSKEKLLDFLKEFTKFYIEEISENRISYSQETKYFRYKYDYNKLGIDDYEDEYKGYGGYVFTDDEEIIKINIMENVTEYTKKEILN